MTTLRRLPRPSRAGISLAVAAIAAATLLPATSSSATTGDQIDQVEAQISALQAKGEAATEAYDDAVISQGNAQRAAAAADASVAREQAALTAQTGMARNLAADEYRNAGVGKLLTLLGSGDPSSFLEQASTLSSVSTTQAGEIADLQAADKRLSDAEGYDKSKQAAVTAVTAQLATDKDNIQSLINQQNSILAGLKAQQRAELLARQQAEARAAAAAAAQLLAQNQARALAAEQAAANAAAAQPANSNAGATAVTIPSSDRASVALQAAYAEIGKPYVYGGAGPDAYDCSGLTMWAFAKAGIALPHSAAGQYGYGTHVSRGELEPGDLVFFDEGGGIGHVGIYAGNGTMIDAPHSGSSVGVHALYPGFVGGTRL